MGDDIFLVPLDSHIATLALLIDRLAFSLLTLPPSSKSQLPAYNQSPQLCGVSYPCHPGVPPRPVRKEQIQHLAGQEASTVYLQGSGAKRRSFSICPQLVFPQRWPPDSTYLLSSRSSRGGFKSTELPSTEGRRLKVPGQWGSHM